MKPLLLLSMSVALVTSVQAQTPAPRFDWKLRLKKGQTWTQTLEVRGVMTPEPGRMNVQFGTKQTLELRNEVLFANPRFLILRATFLRFDEKVSITVNGQTMPDLDRSKYSRALVGVPFKIKQSVDGRVLEVSGLKLLAKRARQSVLTLANTGAERKELLQLSPDVEGLRSRVTAYQQFIFPVRPLAVGESSPYVLEFYPSQTLEKPITINRTLRFFDGQTARFDLSLPRVPDQPKKDGFSNAVAGAITGKIRVDAVTGLPQSDLAIRLDGKQKTVSNNKRWLAPVQEQTRITLQTKLNS